MDTPRSSSNGFFALVCIGILAICGYKFYHDRPTPQKIAVSRLVEPDYKRLFSEFDLNYPMDYVPKLSIARDRIHEKQKQADKDKQAVYGMAITLLDGMIDAGEERTQAMEAILRSAAKPRSSLDAGRAVHPASDLFLQSEMRRSYEALRRRKPALDKLLAQYQNAENQWNARLPERSLWEKYDVPSHHHGG
jgi:hypothetical protein